eukprot:Pgem_evm1s19818
MGDESVQRTAYFSGINNTLAVLEWISSNANGNQNVETLSGSSAGSLGTYVWMNLLAKRFENLERVILDSYMGIFPKIVAKYIKVMGVCINIHKVLGFEKTIEEKCNSEALYDLPSLLKYSMHQHPHVFVHYVAAQGDIVQKLFYVLISFAGTHYASVVEFAMEFSHISFSFADTQQSIIENVLEKGSPQFSSYIEKSSQVHVFISTIFLYLIGDVRHNLVLFLNSHYDGISVDRNLGLGEEVFITKFNSNSNSNTNNNKNNHADDAGNLVLSKYSYNNVFFKVSNTESENDNNNGYGVLRIVFIVVGVVGVLCCAIVGVNFISGDNTRKASYSTKNIEEQKIVEAEHSNPISPPLDYGSFSLDHDKLL